MPGGRASATALALAIAGLAIMLAPWRLPAARPAARPASASASASSASPPSTHAPHIVVIGAGLAGSAAALAAADALRAASLALPARVTLLDKQPRPGGNSAKASSGMSVLTPASGDSRVAFGADLEASAGGRGDDRLRQTLVDRSPAALAWLEARGVALPTVSRLGGHAVDRTRGPAGGAPVGGAVMRAMAAALDADAAVTLRVGTRVVGLVRDGRGRVAGVEVAPADAADGAPRETLAADAVVLATGGYAAVSFVGWESGAEAARAPPPPAHLPPTPPHQSPARLPPALAHLPTTNGPWATGDGLDLAEEGGGAVVDGDCVQLHPTAFAPLADTGDAAHAPAASLFLAPERLRGVGGILLNAGGRRFADELGRRDAVAAAVRAQPTSSAWLVLSPAAAAAYGDKAIGFYVSQGLLRWVEGGAAGVAALLGPPATEATVAATLAAHDAAAGGAAKDEFGRASFAAGAFGVDASPSSSLCVGRVAPALHYTMGGAAIDPAGRVLTRGAAPVPGLYAAGEVAGGVHGANRLGGCSLLDCVVFGTAAGEAAVADWVERRRTGE